MSIVKVAKQAGVSKTTVSRVINTPEAVSAALARKVRVAMKGLDYVPPAVRRGPKPRGKGGTARMGGTVGLVLFGRTRELLAFPLMARIVAAMVETLAEQSMLLSVIEAPEPARLPALLAMHAVNGLLVTGPSPALAQTKGFGSLPRVWLGGVEADIPDMDHVLANHRAMGCMAADHLLAVGCRRMAFVNHDRLHPAFGLLRESFVRRLRDAGASVACFEPESPEVVPARTWSLRAALWEPARLRESLRTQVTRLLDSPARPDGLFLPVDQQTAMACALLRERGVVAGRDVTTISTNNDSIWLGTLQPRPASIDPGAEEMGRQAVRCLLARMAEPGREPVTVMVAPRLVPG